MISFQSVEQLKSELTGKYVVVRSGAPELKRFEKLTGVIKTVNMNGRALVEFDGPADIGWYDIDPAFLKVVDGPRPKTAEKVPEAQPAAAAKASKEAPPAAAGKSPLDLIRGQSSPQQGAVAPTEGAGKPSPLDLIRQSGGGASGPKAPPQGATAKPSPIDLIRQGASPLAEAKVPAKPEAGAGKGLSPIDLIRQQATAKPAQAAPGSESATASQEVNEPTAEQVAEAPAAASSPPPTGGDPPGMSKLELARRNLPRSG